MHRSNIRGLRARRPHAVLVLVGVAVMPHSAIAAPDSTAAPLPLASAVTPANQRSPGTALALSALGTCAPLMIGAAGNGEHLAGYAAAGILVGPSIGYFYGDCPGRGLAGILFRGGIVAASFGVVLASSQGTSDLPPAFALIPLSVAIASVAALYDVGMVSSHVEKRNRSLANHAAIAPTLWVAKDGTPMVGVTWSLPGPSTN